jgi:hypothetical protein
LKRKKFITRKCNFSFHQPKLSSFWNEREEGKNKERKKKENDVKPFQVNHTVVNF